MHLNRPSSQFITFSSILLLSLHPNDGKSMNEEDRINAGGRVRGRNVRTLNQNQEPQHGVPNLSQIGENSPSDRENASARPRGSDTRNLGGKKQEHMKILLLCLEQVHHQLHKRVLNKCFK